MGVGSALQQQANEIPAPPARGESERRRAELVVEHVDRGAVVEEQAGLAQVARERHVGACRGRLPARRLSDALDELWKPYLEGRGTRHEALPAALTTVGSRR